MEFSSLAHLAAERIFRKFRTQMVWRRYQGKENNQRQNGFKMLKQLSVIKAVHLWILSWLCNVESSLKLRPHSAHSYLKEEEEGDD